MNQELWWFTYTYSTYPPWFYSAQVIVEYLRGLLCYTCSSNSYLSEIAVHMSVLLSNILSTPFFSLVTRKFYVPDPCLYHCKYVYFSRALKSFKRKWIQGWMIYLIFSHFLCFFCKCHSFLHPIMKSMRFAVWSNSHSGCSILNIVKLPS